MATTNTNPDGTDTHGKTVESTESPHGSGGNGGAGAPGVDARSKRRRKDGAEDGGGTGAGGAGGAPADAQARANAAAKAAGVPPLCMKFYHGVEHDPEEEGCSALLHCARDERPPCPLYQAGKCPFTDSGCWYPHVETPTPIDANVAVQVAPTHADRLAAWCEAHGMAVAATCRARGTNKKYPRVVCGRVANPGAFGEAVASDPALGIGAVSRVYRLGGDDNAPRWVATLREAVDDIVAGAKRQLEGVLSGSAAPKLRLQAYPKSVERKLTASLADGLDAVGVALSPTAADLLAHCVVVQGCYYTYVQLASEGVSAKFGEAGFREGVVSRAYYKLREAVTRGGVEVPTRAGWAALDVGASPGGWSQYCAELGAARVYAVDPGDVTVDSSAVVHMAMKAEDAVPRLLQEHGEHSIDMFVSDMNIPAEMAVALLTSALPLLRPGAPVVLTVKGFALGKKKAAAERVRAREAFAAALSCPVDAVAEIHTMANRSDERTLIGKVPVA